MKQEEALEQAKVLFPEIAETLTIERSRSIGFKFAHMNEFRLWSHAPTDSKRCCIVATSNVSFEHLLDILKAEASATGAPDDSPIEEPAEPETEAVGVSDDDIPW